MRTRDLLRQELDEPVEVIDRVIQTLVSHTPSVTLFACSPCFQGRHRDCDPTAPCGCTRCWTYVRVTAR